MEQKMSWPLGVNFQCVSSILMPQRGSQYSLFYWLFNQTCLGTCNLLPFNSDSICGVIYGKNSKIFMMFQLYFPWLPHFVKR